MLSDRDLLRQYIDYGSQAAFTALVQRHLNVVYRTALRRVGGNSHAADDVTQRVFMALSHKAEQVRDYDSLAGWLYTSTRFAAAELVRAEQRRRKYEQEAHTMNQLTAADSLSPEQLEPLLDEVLEGLPERDREAVLLHFFERRSFVEIAGVFSSTADATRMRVNRALDRLRHELSKRGIASTGAALSAALGAQATIAATLPDAVAMAAQVLATTTAAPIVGASVAARVFSVLRSAPVAITAGVAVITSGIVVTRRAMADHPSTAAAVAPTPPASPAVIESLPDMPSTAGPSAPATPAQVAQPTVVGASNRSTRFDQFTAQEKSLLALLWRFHRTAPAGQRTSVGVGNMAPNISAIDPLLDQGLIEELPATQANRRRVRLTNAGVEFCEAERAAVERYQPTANLAPDASE